MNKDFHGAIGKTPWAYFEIKKINYDMAKCIENHGHQFSQGQEVSLYELPCIMRTLLIKSKVISNESINQLYNLSDGNLVGIIEWNRSHKSFLLFGPISQEFDEQKLSQSLNRIRSERPLQFGQEENEGRLFARYSVAHLQINFDVDQNFRPIKLLEAGLTGIKIASEFDIKDFDGRRATLKMKDQSFNMILRFAWQKGLEDKNQEKYEAGFSLAFENTKEFEKWLLFTKALQRVARKKESERSEKDL